jgi:hypothetical protein
MGTEMLKKLGLKGPQREAVVTPTGYRVTVTPPVWSGFESGSSVDLTIDQYERYLRWLGGGFQIQEALPELNADQREILMSGIGPQDWDQMKKFEEDD